MWKVLSQGIHMRNMKALSLVVRKLWSRLKFFKSRSNFKVKATRSKITVPCERSCHKEYTCAIWKPYHLWLEIARMQSSQNLETVVGILYHGGAKSYTRIKDWSTLFCLHWEMRGHLSHVNLVKRGVLLKDLDANSVLSFPNVHKKVYFNPNIYAKATNNP